MRTYRAVVFLFFILAFLVSGQSRTSRERRSATSRQAAGTGAAKELAGTFRGTLKDLTNKEITLQNEEGQIVSIRRNRKTKFIKDEHEIKASEIAIDTPITIEAAQDIDLKPMAISVIADSAPKRTSEK